jgi:hypothetical protein
MIQHKTKAHSVTLHMEAVLSSAMLEQFFITWLGTREKESLEITASGFKVLVLVL